MIIIAVIVLSRHYHSACIVLVCHFLTVDQMAEVTVEMPMRKKGNIYIKVRQNNGATVLKIQRISTNNGHLIKSLECSFITE